MPQKRTIIAGCDPSGAHIYSIRNVALSCEDFVGFSSIGAGYWHSDSQIMFAGHTVNKNLTGTVILTHFAKKRAEVAPGVGNSTDLLVIGPVLGVYAKISEEIINILSNSKK